MNEKQKQLREQYVSDHMAYFKEEQKIKSAIVSSRIALSEARVRLNEIENKRFERFEQYLQDLQDAAEKIPTSQEWHQASEQPEKKDGWFLALTKDNLPFLTHYINGWLPQVCQWQYIYLPSNAPS